MNDRWAARAVIACALLAPSCGGRRTEASLGHAALPLVDGGADAGRDAATVVPPSVDGGATPQPLPPRTPNARYDFLSTSRPTLALTRVGHYLPKDVLDKSVSPPEPPDVISPSDLEFFPDGSGDALVVLSTGLLVWLDRGFSIRGTVPVDSSNSLARRRARSGVFQDNEGVLGVTFDPKFEDNGFFYLQVVSEHYGGVDLFRLRWKPDHLDDLWSGRKLLFHTDKPSLATDERYLGNHDGGNPSFGPDGFLYVAIGDGGIGGGLPWDVNPAQDLTQYWGKIIRVDPAGSAPPEIVAYGLRNPFSHVFRGNELFIGDVSGDWANCSDEIDRLVLTPSKTAPPVNFGWPRAGGPCAQSLLWAIGCETTTDPVHWYEKDDTRFVSEDPESTFLATPAGGVNGSAIILGPAYGGGAYDGYLDNVVLYTDLLQGWLRGVLFDAKGRKLADRHLLHHDSWLTGFSVGADAHIYALGDFYTEFSVFRIDLAP